ncbi:MAG TPA: metallophosphoesterase [Vicinamibacterales bacterium]|mgnify:CR=1 FL=1|nr:metallophosphoesterase [Vicinamibacterales bacterium]HOG28417.1 metallophosphoesterase [Vicinamibacterales bacterium]HOQ59315.1 metallophosphoesterase [Vicinamibacterales bacterium]HPK71639.1 metallophosphoesterase [Vicinamibacterales bacterium]HPW21839.1 metallophosphoesterase [Vicinamibacterales bacterium]
MNMATRWRAAGIITASVLMFGLGASSQTQEPPLVRFGVITDLHYADIDPAGPRVYRDSVAKLEACVRTMNAERVAFLVELGDFKDQDTPPVESRTLSYLRTIEAAMAGFKGPRYHVLGNHDVDSLSKAQFLGVVENTGVAPPATRYTFVSGGVRFVVLDACHKADGSDYDRGNYDWTDSNIDAPQLAWLSSTLAGSAEPVIVFVHQQLDGTGSYYVKNAPDVRRVLERSGKVLAVFQGHRHAGAFSEIDGIPYFTLAAAVEQPGAENGAYSIVEVGRGGGIRVIGRQRATSRTTTR